jgi:uncharacterized protein YndB with AHSA1/START domain
VLEAVVPLLVTHGSSLPGGGVRAQPETGPTPSAATTRSARNRSPRSTPGWRRTGGCRPGSSCGAGAESTFGGAPDGRIIDVDPPELFAFSWGTGHLRREIRPDGAGSVLVLHHAFDDHHGAASFASGWSACVEGLGRLLAGETVAPATDMTARHEEYVAEFDLDRPEIDGDTVRVERQLVGPEAAAREVLGDETDGWRVALTRTVPDGWIGRTDRARGARGRRAPRPLARGSRAPGGPVR